MSSSNPLILIHLLYFHDLISSFEIHSIHSSTLDSLIKKVFAKIWDEYLKFHVFEQAFPKPIKFKRTYHFESILGKIVTLWL